MLSNAYMYRVPGMTMKLTMPTAVIITDISLPYVFVSIVPLWNFMYNTSLFPT